MIMYSKEILNILFPNAMEGAHMLQISSIGIILSLLIQTVNGALQGMGKAKECVKALSFGLIIKTILNILLLSIDEIGIYGAIISSIVCHLVTLILCLIKLNKECKIFFSIKIDVIKIIIATSVMMAVSNLSYLSILNFLSSRIALILSFIIGILIYFVLIILLKLFPRDVFFKSLRGKAFKKIKKDKKLKNA